MQNMETSMFERLLQLPLFQGMTKKEIYEVISRVKLDFTNYQAGDEIVLQGDPCKSLVYIISGQMSAEYRDPHSRFILTEKINNVGLIEAYNMFGMTPRYSRTYIFDTNGVTLKIDKAMLLNQLMINYIAKINMLNTTCNQYHQTLKLLRDFPEDTVQDKITKFILSFSSTTRGEKELRIKMTDLADIVHETRLNVSKALNQMQEDNLISLQRNFINIPDIEKLYKRI